MRRRFVRLVMVCVGLLSLSFYVTGAFVTYLVLRAAWLNRPPAAVSMAALAGITLAAGYLSYRFGTERLLATMHLSALSPERAPELHRRLDRLCVEMGIERPRVFVSNLGEPNAFAMSSPDGGVVVVDLGLVSLLSADELESILAHELAHLESYDSLIQLLAFTGLQTVMQVVLLGLLPGLLLFTGLAKADAWFRGRPTAWSASFAWRVRTVVVALVLLVPAVFTFVVLARSRRREFAADARAAEVTGKPIALARALLKVEGAARMELSLRSLFPTEASDVDPLARLLSTHPATDERVDRLRRLAARHPVG